MADGTGNQSTAKRLGDIERTVAEQSVQIEGLTANIQSVAGELHSLTSSVQQFMQHSGRINLSVLAGLGSLVLAIGAALATPYIRDISRVSDEVTDLRKSVIDIKSDRWTRSDHERFRDKIDSEFESAKSYSDQNRDELDEILQREMRLLDDALQREMRTLLDAPKVRISAVEDKLSEVSKLSLSNMKEIAERQRVLEKVDSLERQVNEISSEQRRRTSKVYDKQ